ncbi:hypothetical protein AGABI1DRAFT_90297 [Agaricus bisporus var. burnettii JB137-S8]|uniref:Protein kinase domain-containing protein n=1 Tax=Agaricus bisporus var. burnettii (strain JB137-S8 / ATCC MYA-4627 / FGSC 10392) TaxID=597362 RepID=K5X2E1_AGABU|nr:uncharacterized protein AGABI1DRAFT_90297 [Agaricus bisporus var. burnettii JB137-S8]EKM81986.1 hypothetical protein AGABI1DRAFT_90297 [Agaricus bisporus var. burnettii JB137-S8]
MHASIAHTSSDEESPRIISRTGGFSGRVKQFGKRLVVGGKQLRGVLRGLAHAKTPMQSVEVVQTTLAPETGYPGKTDKISSPVVELSSCAQDEPSDSQAKPPSIEEEHNAGGDETIIQTAAKLDSIQHDSSHSNPASSTPTTTSPITLEGQLVRTLLREIIEVQRLRPIPPSDPTSSIASQGNLGVTQRKISNGQATLPTPPTSRLEANNLLGHFSKDLGDVQVDECCAFQESALWSITFAFHSRHRYSMEWIRSEDERTSEIVKRELNALQRVRGIPNIAHFEYLGGGPIDRYIFLKWMGQVPLAQVLQKRGRSFSLQDTVHAIAQLIHSVQLMHQRGVIHGSISTEKIMVGDDGRLTLFEFTSSTVTTECAALDGDIPFWEPDYAAIAHVWHKMRTLIAPYPLDGTYGACDEYLTKEEVIFLNPLLAPVQSVEALKVATIFNDIGRATSSGFPRSACHLLPKSIRLNNLLNSWVKQ